jgi:hypothetical protein
MHLFLYYPDYKTIRNDITEKNHAGFTQMWKEESSLMLSITQRTKNVYDYLRSFS